MKYTEYLSSAKRHKHACQVLQEKIETYESESINDKDFKNLVVSLYYLSGYIIECSLKFKILELYGYDAEIEIDKRECEKIDLCFHSQIKIHCFQKLQNVLDSKTSSLSHESDVDEIEYLLNEWDPIVRYKEMLLDHQEVSAFYDHAVCFLREM